eukprot:3077202-Rhodomonas_salina.1
MRGAAGGERSVDLGWEIWEGWEGRGEERGEHQRGQTRRICAEMNCDETRAQTRLCRTPHRLKHTTRP